jgi:serine/threonine protein kinase
MDVVTPGGEGTDSRSRRYRILHPVGKGGFGTVYRAELLGEDGFRKPVALKVLNANVQGVAEIASRFRDEARLLGMLRHRAIVQVDGLVHIGDNQVVVMEFVEGVDLALLIKHSSIPCGPALEIVGEVAGALDVAWRKDGPDGTPLRLLHRDIKPANIRITPSGEVKVLDFGIARADFESREATTRSMMFGSEGYMSPERFDMENGPGADVYSVGVVLLEMLLGESIGRTSVRPNKHRAHIDGALGKLQNVPFDIIALIREILAYEADDRPSAHDVEDRCWRLCRTLAEHRLRTWAEQAVGEVQQKVGTPEGDRLSGVVLSEGREVGNSGRVSGATGGGPGPGEVSASFGSPPTLGFPMDPADEPAAKDASSNSDTFAHMLGGSDGHAGSQGAAKPVDLANMADPPATPTSDFGEARSTTELDAMRIAPTVGVSRAQLDDAALPPSPSRTLPAMVGGVALLALVVGGAWWASQAPSPNSEPPKATPAPTHQPAETASAAPAPLGAPSPDPAGPPSEPATVPGAKAEANPAANPEAKPTAKPADTPGISPSTREDAPKKDASPSGSAAAPAAAPTGTARVEGDAQNVQFEDAAGARHPAGALAPGDYTVFADFGAGPVSAAEIRITASATKVVTCTSAFRRCQ